MGEEKGKVFTCRWYDVQKDVGIRLTCQYPLPTTRLTFDFGSSGRKLMKKVCFLCKKHDTY